MATGRAGGAAHRGLDFWARYLSGDGPYRIYFVGHDLNEPPHVHVDRADLSAKFWLAPVALARNLGFSAAELRRVQRLVAEHEPQLQEAWNEHFRK